MPLFREGQMLTIDFANPIDQVRLNIGDLDGEWLDESTINSALVAYNNNVNSASIALFNALCTYFAGRASKEKVGEVQVEFIKRYEYYKQRLDEFVDTGGGSVVPTNKAFLPIIIGGTSKSAKKAIANSADAMSMYEMADWHNNHLGNRTIYEMVTEDLEYALYSHR